MFWNLHCCHLSITWYSQIRSLQKRHRKRERSPNITVKKNCQTKREETKRRRKQTAKKVMKNVIELSFYSGGRKKKAIEILDKRY